MSHIFISYSHKDSEYAHKLADSLQERGLAAWIDDRIDYGTRWPRVIQEHVDTCSAFIVIMTPNSYESEWVQNELARAKRKRKPIFPLLLQGGEPWLSVEATQYCDVRGGKLPPADFYVRLASTVPVTTAVSEALSAAKAEANEKREKLAILYEDVRKIGSTGVALIVLSLLLFLSRSLWLPVIFPPATPTPTVTQALTATPTYTLTSTIMLSTDTPLPPTGAPRPELPTATPIPPTMPVEVETSKTTTISRSSAACLFNGALTIAVVDASKYNNEVTALVSSPGFPAVMIEAQPVGYKIIYEANEKYEVQIVGAVGSALLGDAAAVFMAVRLGGGTPISSVVINASRTVTVSRSSAAVLFDGALTITVVNASNSNNEVTAVVNSPGFPAVRIEEQYAGYKVVLEANEKYEVQIIHAMGSALLGDAAAVFMAVRLGDFVPTTPVTIEASKTVTVNRASAANLFGGALTISVVDASNSNGQVTAIVNSPGFPAVRIEAEQVGYKITYEANKEYEVQVIGAIGSRLLGDAAAVFAVAQLR